MSSIVAAVFKATIGLLVNKGRDLAADRLKEGDVTDQQFRSLIVREIDEIKSKLDGLARTNLLASISFFKEGLVYLYKVLDLKTSEEDGKVTVQGDARIERENFEVGLRSTSAATCSVTTVSLAKEMRSVQVADQGDSTTGALSDAKDRFKLAREKATEAFCNEALSTSDHILAMQYRAMATVLEKVDNPADALAACRLCLEELHSMPAVQKSFNVQLKQGLKSWFNKAEREEIISSVCRVNRVIYDVTQTVTQSVGSGVNLLLWPCIDNGEERVDPLRDSRVIEALRKLDMEQLGVAPWSFGQGGEEEHKLQLLCCIATNSRGQFIIVDSDVKVFDSSGNYMYSSGSFPSASEGQVIATDRDDNLYVLRGRWECTMYMFDKHANLQQQFNLSFCVDEPLSLTVDTYSKTLYVARRNKIEVYETNGRSVRSFGCAAGLTPGFLWSYPQDIATANDGRLLVLAGKHVHVYNAQGNPLTRFKSEGAYIAFQQDSELVVILCTTLAGVTDERPSMLEIYDKDCKFVRCIHLLHTESLIIPLYLRGIALTKNGHVVMCVLDKRMEKHKVLVV